MILDYPMLETAVVALMASLAASLAIVGTQRMHAKYSLDTDLKAVQKFHSAPVPRIGGLAFLTGIATVYVFKACGYLYLEQGDSESLLKLLAASTPAVLMGLKEDATKNVSVKSRLLAAFASALLASWLLDASLSRLDILGIDGLLLFAPLSLIITAIAISGVINAINIIDGFNGFAGSAAVLILAGLGAIAWQAGDAFITSLAIIGIAVTLGFLIVNYPTGRLFMGDGGAYLLGFWIGEIAVLTVVRNPSVGTWQLLAVCAYPIIEVLFSIYRKKFVRRMSPGLPDRVHLHMLVYRRIVCQKVRRNNEKPWLRNSIVTLFVVAWIAPTTLFTVFFGDTAATAIAIFLGQALAYVMLYTRLIRGHWCFVPSAMVIHRAETRT